MHMDEMHPGLKGMIRNCGFSLKRNTILISRTPADQTLDETVNRDATSRITGINAFTRSSDPRIRRTITRTTRSRFVSQALENVGLKKTI